MRWGIHPRFPDYKISENCDVVRIRDSNKYQKAGDVLHGRILTSGYRQFNLRDGNGSKALIRANRLMAEVFLGPAPTPTHHVAHNDGNKLNNHIANLRWATAKENCADMVRHGTKPRGEMMLRAKFKDAQVIEIRGLYSGAHGEIRKLSKEFNVRETYMRKLLRGETYGHLPGVKAPTRGGRRTARS